MIQGSILHSVSYSGSWGQHFLTVEEFIDKAAALGYDGVMLMAKRPHLSVLDWNADARWKLRERLEQRGIACTCVAGYTNFTADLEHGDIPQREMQIRHVTDLAQNGARSRGADRARVHRVREPGGGAAGAVEDRGRGAAGVRPARGRLHRHHRGAEPSRSRVRVREPGRTAGGGGRAQLPRDVRRVGAGAARGRPDRGGVATGGANR